MKKNKNYQIVIILILFNVLNLNSEALKELFEADFEELLNMEINTTSLIYMPYIKSPQVNTIINSKDITNSGARNILDIMETFVPATAWTAHHDVPHIGVRGLMGDRNNKVLLLVNDRYMNLKAHSGVSSEVDNWDMNDIYKIEFVRGTGSANWGPAAATGTIRITTKNAINSEGLNLGAIYNPTYNSKGLYISNGIVKEDFNLYLYASIVSTTGAQNSTSFQAFNNYIYGMIGEDMLKNDEVSDEFADYNNIPQIKLYSELNIGKEWKIWSRYVNSGTNSFGLTTRSAQQIGYLDDGLALVSDNKENFKQNKFSHFVLSINNLKKLNDNIKLNSFISYDQQTFARRESGYSHFRQQDSLDYADPNLFNELQDKNHLRNYTAKFAEQEILLKSTLNFENNSGLIYAVGGELSYNYYGKPLFGDRTDFRLGDSYNIISGKDSKAFNDFVPYISHWNNYGGVNDSTGYFVGDGWSSIAVAFFGEVNYKFNDDFEILASGRIDKDTYSNILFSPRLTGIYSLNKDNVIKTSINKYQRMNIAEQLYVQKQLNVNPSNENLFGIDLIYTSLISKSSFLNISTFYNDIDIIGWNEGKQATENLGNLKTVGFEIEYELKIDDLDFNISHSFLKPISIEQSLNTQYFAYSFQDYKIDFTDNQKYPRDSTYFKGIGNDITNWSNNITKFRINYSLFDKFLTLGLFGQYYWGYQGSQDGLDMIKNAVANTTFQKGNMQNLFDIMDKYNVYGSNFRLNLQVNANITDKLELRCSAFNLMNLINKKYSKRHVYDAGLIFSEAYYRNGFYLEPTSFQISLNYNL